MKNNQPRLSIVNKMNSNTTTIELLPEEISYIVSRYIEQHTQKRVDEYTHPVGVMTITIDSDSILKSH